MSDLDKETEERIEEPVSEEAVRETRSRRRGGRQDARQPAGARQPQARKLLERVNDDKQVKAWWHVANVNAVVRMEINDHSWVHIQIVEHRSQLVAPTDEARIEPSAVRDSGSSGTTPGVSWRWPRSSTASACRCTATATRTCSLLFLSEPKMRKLFDGILDEPNLTWIVSEDPQAITRPLADGQPLALEGSSRGSQTHRHGRGPLPDPVRGKSPLSIASLSAAAIRDVLIKDGKVQPVMIEIVMNNSSGLFQVDGLLKAKLRRLRPRAVRRGDRPHRHRGREAARPDLPPRNVVG